jgi:hypothetical protein
MAEQLVGSVIIYVDDPIFSVGVNFIDADLTGVLDV